MKLQIKHLAPYLPYDLKWNFEPDDFNHLVVGIENTTNGIILISPFNDYGRCDISDGKPVLIPLSDLTEEHNKEIRLRYPNAPNWQYFYKEWISENEDLSETIIEYSVLEYLFECHFDVFGLIEKGLAIDINSINNQ